MTADLRTLLQAELEESRGFLDILLEEHQALEANDAGEISRCAELKLQCLDRMESLDQQRHEWLHRHGHESMQHALTSSDSRTRSVWQQLLDVARQCHDQNLMNGQIIEGARQRTRDAIAILRSGTRGASTYDTHGSLAAGPLQSRPLAKV